MAGASVSRTNAVSQHSGQIADNKDGIARTGIDVLSGPDLALNDGACDGEKSPSRD
jgi:hypothetical protein